MRWVREPMRAAWGALAAHPFLFTAVTLAVAALNVFAPVAILSAVRKPLDYYTGTIFDSAEDRSGTDAETGEKLER